MPLKTMSGISSGSGTTRACSISSLFLTLSLLFILLTSLFFLLSNPTSAPPRNVSNNLQISQNSIKVYMSELPRSLNYGLLEEYWALASDSRLGSEVDNEIRKSLLSKPSEKFPPYPENPLIKQYSAEYWITGDLLTSEELKKESLAKRVFDFREADVVFVPFFATLSAEMQLGVNKGVFRKKVEENEDYQRQKMMVDLVRKSEAWQRSGGRDHVFVLTGNVRTYGDA